MQDIIDTLFTILWYVINYLLFYVIIRTAHNLVMSSDCFRVQRYKSYLSYSKIKWIKATNPHIWLAGTNVSLFPRLYSFYILDSKAILLHIQTVLCLVTQMSQNVFPCLFVFLNFWLWWENSTDASHTAALMAKWLSCSYSVWDTQHFN